MAAHFERHPASRSLPRPSRDAATWKWSTRLAGTLALNEVNQQAGQYPGVSALGGADAMTWTTLLDGRLARRVPSSVLQLDLRASYGRVRQARRSREAVDRLQTEAVYTLRQPTPSPFVGIQAHSVWTVPDSQDRPVAVRASAGLAVRTGRYLTTRCGLGLERDWPAARSRALRAKGKAFYGANAPRRVSAEAFNSLTYSLFGNLRAIVDANLFLHRDAQVQRTGLRTEFQVGLAYSWDARWVRP
jgi:hypothetical protein